MKKDIESRLRDALRPVTPTEDYTRRLIEKVSAKAVQGSVARGIRPAARHLWWLSGMAASLLIAAGVQQHVRAERETAAGLEARRQVLQALRMTGQKLDLAYEAVRSQSASFVDAEAGA